ncbi:hyaluronidase [Mycoplasmopsis canis UFG4]|uniref:Hyaluronidase n=1 Tax=Mycoplasmopsis canis UFG4 TaxID=1131455 RepID=I1A765_9BACT|nr:beta-N-acetylglucosaminidase domain-containing protein [Mycoplasmopsis canis]EIE42336.1 hyaluronidase [Mycoplasmopsis canis UFG4]
MKISKKRIFKTIFALSPIFASPLFISTSNNDSSEKNVENNFSLNVLAKSISYKNSYSILKNKINIIAFSNNLKELDSFNAFLTSKGFDVTISEKIDNEATNIFISDLRFQNELVDSTFISNSILFNFSIEHNDEYFIESKNNLFFIQSNSDNGLFYSFEKIKDIIESLDNNVIQDFVLNDFFVVKNRVIQDSSAFSNEAIKSNILNAKKHGFNKYSYFNKQNLKNWSDWRTLYNEEDLKNVKELNNFALSENIDFIYGLNVFANEPISSGSYYEFDLELVKSKINQLIDLGIKSFAFNSIDGNRINSDLEIRFLNDITNWLSSIKDLKHVNNQVYYFTNKQSDINNLSNLANYNENVFIVMSGDKKYNVINNDFIDNFYRETHKKANLILNWPEAFNEGLLNLNLHNSFSLPSSHLENINSYILNLGSNKSINDFFVHQFSNIFKENNDTSSFSIRKEIRSTLKLESTNDPIIDSFINVSQHIKKFNKHENEVITVSESSSFESFFEVFYQKVQNNTYQEEDLKELRKIFSKLKNDTDILKKHEAEFINSIKPWLNKISMISQAFLFLDSALLYNKNNLFSELNENVFYAQKLISEINDLKLPKKNLTFNGGTEKLLPSLKKLWVLIKNSYGFSIDRSIDEVEHEFISSRGKNANLAYGTSTDKVLFKSNNQVSVFDGYSNKIRENDYFGTEFSKPITLNKIYVKMGDGSDHFYNYVFEYKLLGDTEWQQIGEARRAPRGTFSPVTIDSLNIKNVKSVRVRNLSQNPDDGWIRIFNFVVNDRDQEIIEEKWYTDATLNSADTPNIQTRNGHENRNIFDNNPNSEWWLTSHGVDKMRQNSSVSISYPSKREITRVLIEQGASRSSDVQTNFHIEYFDEASNSWKRFGSHQLDGSRKQIVTGYAFTQKIKLVIDTERNAWWRLGTFKAGGPQKHQEQTFTVKSTNLAIPSNPSINDSARNNRFEFITDNDESSYAWMSHAGNNGNIMQNDHLDILFNDFKEIKTIRILQSRDEVLRHFKIQKIVNDTYTDITEELSSDNDNLQTWISVPENAGKMNGIRILSTQNSNRWWALRSVDIVDKELPQNNLVFISDETMKNEFSAIKEAGLYKLINSDFSTSKEIAIQPNEFIGLDFEQILKINQIKANFESSGLRFFVSSNGSIWEEISNLDKLYKGIKGRYLIIKNSQDSQVNINFNSLEVLTSEKTNFGNIVETNFNNKIDSKLNNEFDNDLETSNIFKSPTNGKYIIYDLSQNIHINSLKIFTSENSYNFPRNLLVEVSRDKNNWWRVFEIPRNNSNEKLENVITGLYDENKTGFRYWGQDNLDISNIRYIKISVRENYPENRDLEINEIIINNEDSPEKDFDLNAIGNDLSKNPSNILDKDLLTNFEAESANGILKLVVDDEKFKNKDIQIFSEKTSLDTVISAKVFNIETNSEEVIQLGYIVNNLMSFALPTNINKKLLEIIITWKDDLPIINEILPIDKSSSIVDKSELQNLVETEPENFANWINVDKEKFNLAKNKAKKVIESGFASQSSIEDLKNNLRFIISHAELKSNGTLLEEAIKEKLNNKNNFYSSKSFSKYLNIVNKIETSLKDLDNFSINDESESIKLLGEAKNSLEFSVKQRAIASDLFNMHKQINRDMYKSNGLEELDSKAEDLRKSLLESNFTPANYFDLIQEYYRVYNSLEYNYTGFEISSLKKLLKEAKEISSRDSVNWENAIRNLNKAISETESILEKENNDLSFIQQESNKLVLYLNEYKNTKTSILKPLDNYLEHNYLHLFDLMVPESAVSYNNSLTNAYNAIQKNNISEQKVFDFIKEIENSKKEFKIQKDVVRSKIAMISDKIIEDQLIQRLNSLSNNENDILNFLNDVYNLNDTNYKNELIKYKEVINNFIKNIDNKNVYNIFSERIQRAYNHNILDEIKKDIILYNKESSKNEEYSKTTNKTFIVLGVLFTIVTLGVLGGFFVKKYLPKKKNN